MQYYQSVSDIYSMMIQISIPNFTVLSSIMVWWCALGKWLFHAVARLPTKQARRGPVNFPEDGWECGKTFELHPMKMIYISGGEWGFHFYPVGRKAQQQPTLWKYHFCSRATLDCVQTFIHDKSPHEVFHTKKVLFNVMHCSFATSFQEGTVDGEQN